jgi:DNA repair photolyase
MHPSFPACGEDPFGFGYAIVDPGTPERVARDAARIRERGLVQLCTLTDAWAPEAQKHQLGRCCLEAILSQPGWHIRVLTKNAAVTMDFDVVQEYRERVLVGLSITGTPAQEQILSVIELNASPIGERVAALREASRRGLRTYAMFCPLLPGIMDTRDDIEQLIELAVDCRAEEIFVEPLNSRGPGLRRCQEAFEQNGFPMQACAIAAIRERACWSNYVVALVSEVQHAVRNRSDVAKLRFLLYGSKLLPEDKARIEEDDAGVVWLGEDAVVGPKGYAG